MCCSLRDDATDNQPPSQWCARYTRATGLEGWRLSRPEAQLNKTLGRGTLLSSSGQLLLSSSGQLPLDARTSRWRCAQPHMYGELKGVRGHSEWVVSAKFSPEWRVIDRSARTGFLSSSQLFARSHASHQNDKHMIHAAGAFIVTASYDKTAILWSMATLQPITTFRAHTGTVWSASFAHKRPMVVTASADHTVRVWDIGAKACVAALEYNSAVFSARFDVEDRHVAVALKGGGQLMLCTYRFISFESFSPFDSLPPPNIIKMYL